MPLALFNAKQGQQQLKGFQTPRCISIDQLPLAVRQSCFPLTLCSREAGPEIHFARSAQFQDLEAFCNRSIAPMEDHTI